MIVLPETAPCVTRQVVLPLRLSCNRMMNALRLPPPPPPFFFSLSQQPSPFGTVQGQYCTVSYSATVLRPDAELLLAPILGNLIGLHPVSYVLRSISDSEKPPSPGIPDLGSQSTRTCMLYQFHSESSPGLAPEDPPPSPRRRFFP